MTTRRRLVGALALVATTATAAPANPFDAAVQGVYERRERD